MALFGMKSIARKSRKIFGRMSLSNKPDNNDMDHDSAVDTVSSSLIELVQLKVDIGVITKDEQPLVADDQDDSENDLHRALADDERFASELAEFESRMMATEVPEDDFEEDFDSFEIMNARSEMEDDMRDLTKLLLWYCVDQQMLLEEVRYSIAAASEEEVYEPLALGAFEAESTNVDVPFDELNKNLPATRSSSMFGVKAARNDDCMAGSNQTLFLGELPDKLERVLCVLCGEFEDRRRDSPSILLVDFGDSRAT